MTEQPTHIDSPLEAFRLAVKRAGGQIPFGKLCGRTQGAVSKRLKKGERIWPDAILRVEAATKISRHDIDPDIYPIESHTAAPTMAIHAAGPAAGSACDAAGHQSSGEAA